MKNTMKKNNDVITLREVRLSFPHVFEAKAINEAEEAKFSASFILHKKRDAAQIEAFKCTITDAAVAKLGENRASLLGKKLRTCLHDGSEKTYDGYGPDVVYITASNRERPAVVDRNRAPLTAKDRLVYGGCFVNAALRIWVLDHARYGVRVNAELLAVQFVCDGERFGRPAFDPNDAFKELEPPDKQSALTDNTKELCAPF